MRQSCALLSPEYRRPLRWSCRSPRPTGNVAIYGYEATRVVLAAIAKAGQKADDRSTVRELIMATMDFDGVLGKWSFDGNGDKMPLAISRDEAEVIAIISEAAGIGELP